MAHAEDILAMAERHAQEAEEHVAHQLAIIAVLDRDHHPAAATLAREVLTTLQRSLELAREHVSIERKARGLGR